jgi:hypothetical protein
VLAVSLLAALAPVTNAATFGHSSLPPGAVSSPKLPLTPSITLTQNTSNSIVSGNSVSCNNGIGSTENHYLRRFLLDTDHGIHTPFVITGVSFGIEQASTQAGSQPLTVNVYSIPKALPLLYANLVPLGTVTQTLADQSLTIVTFPVSATLTNPASDDLVVEVMSYDGEATSALFFIGSNSAGELHPSYISAADCGITEPTTVGGIGFPNMMTYMAVLGTAPVPTRATSWSKVKSIYR